LYTFVTLHCINTSERDDAEVPRLFTLVAMESLTLWTVCATRERTINSSIRTTNSSAVFPALLLRHCRGQSLGSTQRVEKKLASHTRVVHNCTG